MNDEKTQTANKKGLQFVKKYVLPNWQLYLMVIPALTYFIIFAYGPMSGVQIAFKDYIATKGIWGSPWVGFKNFEYLFATPDAFIITRNTILYNVAFLLVNTFFSILIAIGMNELKSKKLKKTYQGIMFIPHFISMVTVGYIVYVFLSPQ